MGKSHKHRPKVLVLQVVVVLVHPAQLGFQMRSLIADRCHDANGLTCFDDAYYLIGLCACKIGLHELIAAVSDLFDIQNLDMLLGATGFHPLLILFGDAHQVFLEYRKQIAVLTEEAHGAGSIQKRWYARVQNHAVEAGVAELDAILVMFVKGVHWWTSLDRSSWEHTP